MPVPPFIVPARTAPSAKTKLLLPEPPMIAPTPIMSEMVFWAFETETVPFALPALMSKVRADVTAEKSRVLMPVVSMV